MDQLVTIERIEARILLIRDQKVMLDRDLVELYGVETKYLIRQVKRNTERFPEDFMFQLTKEESLRCQNVTSSWGGRRYLPYAFTEQGVAMLSSVLNSKMAILVNIQIMRTFTKLRKLLASNEDLRKKIEAMENKYDVQFKVVFDAIKSMMSPPTKEQKRIGFRNEKD